MFMALVAGKAARQVTFGAAGTGAALDAISPVAVPYPADIVGGSFLVLHVVATSSGTPTITTPDGWTITNSQTMSGIVSTVFHKRADGTESGSLDVTFVGDAGALGRMYRFSHGSGVEAAAGSTDNTADTSITAVDVTTTVAKAMAVQCFYHGASTTIGAISGESNADYTEAVAEFNTTGATLSCQAAEVATAAAISGGAATAGSNGIHAMHGFAIKP